MTPAIDGAFAALARDRIAAHPFRYHVSFQRPGTDPLVRHAR